MSALLSELAKHAPVAGHRPWPRYLVDAASWSTVARALGAGEADLLSLWADEEGVHLALRSAELRTPAVVSVGVKNGTRARSHF